MSDELNRAYDALQQAHDAGNTEDAQQIADYIRTMEGASEPAAPVQQDQKSAYGAGTAAATIGGVLQTPIAIKNWMQKSEIQPPPELVKIPEYERYISPNEKYAAKTGYSEGDAHDVKSGVEARNARIEAEQGKLGAGKVAGKIQGSLNPDVILQQAKAREAEEARNRAVQKELKQRHHAAQIAKITDAQKRAALQAEQMAEQGYRKTLPAMASRSAPGILFNAAANAQDLQNNLQSGDYGQSLLNVAGMASSAAPFVKALPRKYRAPIAAAGAMMPAVNAGIDAIEGKADGGAVHMAGGGGLSIAEQVLKRAPAKTKQQIWEIAQRMAPQELGQFLRAPGKTTSVAGKSLKQYEHEKNLEHDIRAGLHDQYALHNLKPIDWNAEKGGVSLILPGDASGVDTIHSIAGRKLANPSEQEGGFPFALKYAQENPDAPSELWSSTGRAARGYFDLGKRVAEQYGTQNILPTYSKMPNGMEYALHFNDALRQGLKPAGADIRMLDDLMRQGNYKGHSFEDFKGFGDDDYVTQYMKDRPEFRKHFGARMQVQDFLKQIGLPGTYGSDVMHAVTMPELRNVETGAGGNMIGRLDLNRETLSPSTHGTYENKNRDPGVNIPGEVVGKTKYVTPYEMLYSDSLASVRANPKQAPQEFGSLKMTGARQIIDPQHVDEMGMYDEAMKSLVGYEGGGKVGALSSLAKPLVNRLNMHFKDVTKRIPELQESAKKLLAGEGSRAEHEALVNQHKPVTPFSFVPTPATREEAVNALTSDKKDLYGVPSQTLPAGHPVGLRLDIPAYSNHGVWVPTVHEQASGFGAGKSIGHESVASVLNPQFGMSEKAAMSIASGKPKGTIATIKGNWNPVEQEAAVANAQDYLNHPDWAQVGMDPERHSYFYDRATMEPITHAEEALQIGPLVLAKKPVYGKKEDFQFAEGGLTHLR